MVHKVFLVCSCLFTCCVFAQPSRIQADSLKIALQKHTARDTNRVVLLIKYANDLFYVQPDSSLMGYADEALQIAKELKWNIGIARSLGLKAVVYQYFWGNPEEALHAYQTALRIDEGIGDKGFQWSTLMNIGNIYLDMEENQQALDYYNRAYEIMQQQISRKGEDQLLNNMGEAYSKLHQNVKAEDFYAKSILAAERVSDLQVVANTLCSRGLLYRNEKKITLAEDDLKRGIALAEKYNFTSILVVGLVNLAETYIDAKNYGVAEKCATKALQLARQMNMRKLEVETIGTLADLYSANGNAKKAVSYYEQYQPMHDSLLSDETKQSLTRAEMDYHFKQKEDSMSAEYNKQQVLSEAKLQKQHILNSSVMGGLGIMLVAGFTSFIFYKKRRDAEGQKQEAEFQTQIIAVKMKTLRAYMNPHFIGNSLGSIRNFILKNDTQDADYFLTKFAGLMRVVLNNSMQEEISLAGELSALEWYMQMEALRLNNRFTYQIRVDDAIDKQVTAIPPLILQPFVENCIKHGIGPKEGKGKILIAFKKIGLLLSCIVEDDGIGRAQAAMMETIEEDNNGKGIEITKERIAVINTMIPANASVSFFDLAEGLRVEIKLPYRLLPNDEN